MHGLHAGSPLQARAPSSRRWAPSARPLPAQARRSALVPARAPPPTGLRRPRCRPPPLQRLQAELRRERGEAPRQAMPLGQIKPQAGKLAVPWRGAQAPRQAMLRGQLEQHPRAPPPLGEGPRRQRQRRRTGRTHSLRR
jgi:hypothetical protein